MRLIQQFKPFTTRTKTVKIGPKHVALIGLTEDSKTIFDIVWSDNSPLYGSFVGYLPIRDCGIHISTDVVREAKKNGKHPIYFNSSVFKSLRSTIVDITPILQKLEKRGFKYPYVKKYQDFVVKCLKTLNEKLQNYDYKLVYDVIDVSKLPDSINTQTLRHLRLYATLNQLRDDSFKTWFDHEIGRIFTTLKLVDGSYLNVLVYDADHKAFSKLETVIPRFISLLKYFTRDSSVDEEIDKKTESVLEKLKQIIPTKKIREIVSSDIKQFANTYPDEIANVNTSDQNEILKTAAKAVKATITDDADVESVQEAKQIINELTRIQIEPPAVPNKLTDEDTLSPIRNEAVQTEIGNISESRRIAFQNLENFVKVFNTYFAKLQFRIVSVDRKPVEVKDIAKTEQEELVIVIEDLKTGRYHTINLLIPKIIDDNYFLVSGVKRVLIHQLFPLPVVSYRPGEVIIRTNFANATITLETKNKVKSFYGVVLGKKLPVILLFILYHKSLGNALKALKIDYEVTDSLSESAIKLPDGKFLIIKSKEPEKQLLLNGLKQIKQFPEEDSFEAWLDAVSNFVSHRFAHQIELYFDRFIDPLTYYILKTENLPETVDGLFWYACQLAYSGVVTSQTDLRYRRIRSVEVFAILIYKRLYYELYKYRMKEEMSFGDKKTKNKISIPKDALLKDLQLTDAISQYQAVDAINPVIEASYVTRVTYAGYGGIKSENVPLTMRNVDPTYFGTICPVDSPECLSPNTLVYKRVHGKPVPSRIIDIKPGDEIAGPNGYVKVLNKMLTYKDTYEITLENGETIIASKDHRFYVFDKKENVYVILSVEEIMQNPNRYEFAIKHEID